MKVIILFVLMMSGFAYAVDNDRGKIDSEGEVIPLDKLKYQMEIQGDVLVFDKTTSRLLFKGNEERKWQFGNEGLIESNWSFEHKGLPSFGIKHEWSFDANGKLLAKIKQYELVEKKGSDEPDFGKLVKEKDFSLDNLESVHWVVGEKDSKRLVVRFSIVVWSDNDAVDIGRLGINSGRMMVFDGRGNLWASRINNSDGNNVYMGLQTHKGSLYISYVPFKGAKKVGVAEKNRIKLEDNGMKIYIESVDALLPKGVVAHVYGIIDTRKRTDRYNSIRIMTSDKEESFLNRIKE